MNIIIKTKKLELTPSLEHFINKKVNSLQKFLGVFKHHELPMKKGHALFDTLIEVGRESKHHRKGDVYKTEIMIALPGKHLFAQATGDDVIKTINEARNEIEREIRKYKTKTIEFPRRKSKKMRDR